MLDPQLQQQLAAEVHQRFLTALAAAEARPGSFKLGVTPLAEETGGFLIEVVREGSPVFRHEVGEVPLDATLGDVARAAVKQLQLSDS
jgi:hypothetical protein